MVVAPEGAPGLHDVPIELATVTFPVNMVENPGEVGRTSVTLEPVVKPEPTGEVNVKTRVLPVEPATAEVGLTVMVPAPSAAGAAL